MAPSGNRLVQAPPNAIEDQAVGSFGHLSQWKAKRVNLKPIQYFQPGADPTIKKASTRKRRNRTLTGARQAQATTKLSAGCLALQDQMVTIPMSWFLHPLHCSMRVCVRPPTARTRRAQRVIEVPMPYPCFVRLMSVFATGDLEGLEWIGPQELKPTNSPRSTVKEYNYKLRQPAQLDRLWEMEAWDAPRHGKAWRRGRGAARLHLSMASEDRGTRSSLLSMVCGNVSIRPRLEARCQLAQSRARRDIAACAGIFRRWRPSKIGMSSRRDIGGFLLAARPEAPFGTNNPSQLHCTFTNDAHHKEGELCALRIVHAAVQAAEERLSHRRLLTLLALG
ncbi:hypothetical protein AB1Y20_001316 [Prymnesium parvum]|uniref:Uncharacterized protein n=1 Tax=Prymnesium parvum TaxID=97485 RepID=A0AB34KBP2_PRYPA